MEDKNREGLLTPLSIAQTNIGGNFNEADQES